MELIKLLLMQKYLMGKDDSESDKEFYKLLKSGEESKKNKSRIFDLYILYIIIHIKIYNLKG